MKNVANRTVLQNANAQSPKHQARKNPKHPERSPKRPVMDLVISLVTSPIAIVATQIVQMNVPKYLMLTICLHLHAMMMYLHQKRHYLNVNTPIGAHGRHAVLPV